jgi:hypothetical protein
MEEEGIMVGEMQKLLIQKVEELTLYVIELNNQNRKSQSEIEALRQANKDLQEMLKK